MDTDENLTIIGLEELTASSDQFAIGLRLSAAPHYVLTELIETLEGPGLIQADLTGALLVLHTRADPAAAESVVSWFVGTGVLEQMQEQARTIEERRDEAVRRVTLVLEANDIRGTPTSP